MTTMMMMMAMHVVAIKTAKLVYYTAAITKARGRGDTGTVRASRSVGRALSLQAPTVSINATVRVVLSFGTAVCYVRRFLLPMCRYLVAWNIQMDPSIKVNGIITGVDMVSGGIPLQLVVQLSGAVVLVVGDAVLRTVLR